MAVGVPTDPADPAAVMTICADVMVVQVLVPNITAGVLIWKTNCHNKQKIQKCVHESVHIFLMLEKTLTIGLSDKLQIL